jgi:hypothetical protein
LVNFFGSFRKAMISSSSSLASSTPATSSNVTLCWFSVRSLARLFPKDIALPPPTCIWRMKNTQRPISRIIGNQLTRSTYQNGSGPRGARRCERPWLRRSLISSGYGGAKVRNASPFVFLPWRS